MKAVNLIPSEQRRGVSGISGRTGPVPYVVGGGLAVVVGLGLVYGMAVNTVSSRTSELASINEQVSSVQSQASALGSYVQFASVSAQRSAAVAAIAQQRFNWPAAMEQLALALPSGVHLDTLNASDQASSAAPVGATGAMGATGNLAPGPNLTLAGCARSHDQVATVLARLRQMHGVASAELQNSTKQVSGAAGAATSSGTCNGASFAMTLSYAPGYGVPGFTPQTVSTAGATGTPVAHSAAVTGGSR